MPVTRRHFLVSLSAATALPALAIDEANPLHGAIGVTTGSFVKHLSSEPAVGKLVMLDLPRIMRDELDLRVLDLMTATLPSLQPEYCDRFRKASEQAGCIITNLKMNQHGLDMADPDLKKRSRSLEIYKRTIDAAHRLGCRWVRPATPTAKQDPDLLTASFRELIDYGADKGITLLVENNGWMRDEPDAIPSLVAKVGKGLASQPDLGNWTDRARYEGLQKAFPSAVSCDFKALKLGKNAEHTDWDLKRCFDIAWAAGFRGPWCFEHFHDELKGLLHDMTMLRDLLRGWMREAKP